MHLDNGRTLHIQENTCGQHCTHTHLGFVLHSIAPTWIPIDLSALSCLLSVLEDYLHYPVPSWPLQLELEDKEAGDALISITST